MPTGTYATDLYLPVPARSVKAARSASRCASSAISHGSPRQPATKPSISSCREAMTRPGSKAKSPPTSGQTPAGPEILDR
jgi:hypothetical protein